MGFFKSLKGGQPDKIGESPSYQHNESSSSQHSAASKHPLPHDEPVPPSYPPQADREQYTPPAGPPLSHHAQYAPPSGPPPSHQTSSDVPAYHDWTVVPDTALLPPPPLLGHESSPASNASLAEADRAHAWCRANVLYQPRLPNNDEYGCSQSGNIRPIQPREFSGSLVSRGIGVWNGSTRAGNRDACLVSNLPLYFAEVDSPLRTEVTKTIYYEVRVLGLGGRGDSDESSLALGFSALPYPTWRMPGWERGSLAVHSDDGRRYVADTWGGKSFTSPIQVGQTVGIGMTFSISHNPPGYNEATFKSPLAVDVFFTREGRREDGWDLHEELDATNDVGVDGLEGNYDLHAAVGVFGPVDFEISFNRTNWLFQPN